MVATPNPWICLLLPAEKKRNSLNKLNFSLKKIIPLKRVLYWTLPKVHEHSNTVVKQPICEQISLPKPIGIYLGHGVRVGGKIFDRLPLRRAKERLLKRNSITASYYLEQSSNARLDVSLIATFGTGFWFSQLLQRHWFAYLDVRKPTVLHSVFGNLKAQDGWDIINWYNFPFQSQSFGGYF